VGGYAGWCIRSVHLATVTGASDSGGVRPAALDRVKAARPAGAGARPHLQARSGIYETSRAVVNLCGQWGPT
jgi:hypothetical protein